MPNASHQHNLRPVLPSLLLWYARPFARGPVPTQRPVAGFPAAHIPLMHGVTSRCQLPSCNHRYRATGQGLPGYFLIRPDVPLVRTILSLTPFPLLPLRHRSLLTSAHTVLDAPPCLQVDSARADVILRRSPPSSGTLTPLRYLDASSADLCPHRVRCFSALWNSKVALSAFTTLRLNGTR